MDGALESEVRLPKAGWAALSCLGFVVWSLGHGYAGIFHDAGLYTLQALARLHPDTLSDDVFLKFGSQDRFTLFSPLYAALSGWIGVEPAAALLTLTLQTGFCLCAFLLAKTVLPACIAPFSLVLLLAVPGYYGADRIFACIESFVTPRMGAEALVLAALTAGVRDARWLAAGLTAAAALIHPIMASAGIGALYWLYLGERRLGLAIALSAAIAAVGTLCLAIHGRFPPDWGALVSDRSPYLFLGSWTIDDWARAAVTLVTLAAEIATLPNGKARSIAKASLLTCATGIALTYIGCDLLRVVLLTQLQPWRSMWLGVVVAVLLLPQALRLQWHTGRAHRTTALLLLAAWIFAANAYALTAAIAALASLAGAHRMKDAHARWIWIGAAALLSIAVAWRLACNLEFTDSHYAELALPEWLRRSMSFAQDGAAPAAVLALIWWLSRLPRARWPLAGVAAAGAAACAILMPFTVQSWTARQFPPEVTRRWAAVRADIPARADVFWPDSPVAVWLLLDRPSYLSVIQTSGLVFSKPAALELNRRASALRDAVAPAAFMDWNGGGMGLNLSQRQLEAACASGQFDFLVSAADLGVAPVAAVTSTNGPDNRKTRLYRCREQKIAGPGQTGPGVQPLQSQLR